MKILAKIIVLGLVFFAGVYASGQGWLDDSFSFSQKPKDQVVATAEIKVSLMLDYGGGVIKTYNDIALPVDATAFDKLKKVTTDNNLELKYKDYGGDLGVLIETIGDKTNDVKTNTFWEYWVNNNHAPVGAGSYKLKNGDIVEWKYGKSQY